MGVLVAARTVQGVGAGAIPAVAYAAIGRAYPAALQPRMFAVLSSAWVLPGLIGPAISGTVAEAFGWRWVFLGLLPLVGLAAVMTVRALIALGAPAGDEPVDRRLDALTLVAGAALVLAGASSHSAVVTPVLVVAGIVVGARAFSRLGPPRPGSGAVSPCPDIPRVLHEVWRRMHRWGAFGSTERQSRSDPGPRRRRSTHHTTTTTAATTTANAIGLDAGSGRSGTACSRGSGGVAGAIGSGPSRASTGAGPSSSAFR